MKTRTTFILPIQAPSKAANPSLSAAVAEGFADSRPLFVSPRACQKSPPPQGGKNCVAGTQAELTHRSGWNVFSGLVKIIVPKKLLHATKQWLLLAQWWCHELDLLGRLRIGVFLPPTQEMKDPETFNPVIIGWNWAPLRVLIFCQSSPARSSDFSSFSTAAAGAPSLLRKPWNLREVSNEEVVKIHSYLRNHQVKGNSLPESSIRHKSLKN